MGFVSDTKAFIKSLNLEDKISPFKNPDIIWFYIFFPSVIAYLIILSNFMNDKPITGHIELVHDSFNKLINTNSNNMEIIASNLQWSEGPLWIDDESDSISYLMFSDTKMNRIYKWEEGKGLFTVGKSIYIEDSGCFRNRTYCESLEESGSNGLLRKDSSSLDFIVCQHGERAIGVITDNGLRFPIATHYKTQRLNSPNDLVYSPEGHLYFTDPAFGLVNKEKEIVGKELRHNGVYMIRKEYLEQAIEEKTPTPFVLLMDGSLRWPNGLAFSPDYSKLYVSDSDNRHPHWKVYDVTDSGLLVNGRVFFDATELYRIECAQALNSTVTSDPHSNNNSLLNAACGASVGLPDGLKVDIHGNVFASGPGGVLVLSAEGTLIGRLRLDRPVSNLAFGSDGRLYITAGDVVIRVKVKTKPTRIVSRKKK